MNVVKRARSRCTQLRTRLQTPRCSAVLLALLLVSLVWISWEDEWYNRSTVGRFVRQLTSNSARSTDLGGMSFDLDDRYVVWIDGEPRLMRQEAYLGDPIVLAAEQDGAAVVYVVWLTREYRKGWWAITRNVRWEMLWVVDQSKNATPAQLEEAKWLYAALDPRYAAAANGRVDHVRLLWGGIVINIATLLAALAFMVSLGWVPRRVDARRGKLRLAQGLCPKCAYDLTGLHPAHASDSTRPDEPAARCPECGQPLPAGRA